MGLAFALATAQTQEREALLRSATQLEARTLEVADHGKLAQDALASEPMCSRSLVKRVTVVVAPEEERIVSFQASSNTPPMPAMPSIPLVPPTHSSTSMSMSTQVCARSALNSPSDQRSAFAQAFANDFARGRCDSDDMPPLPDASPSFGESVGRRPWVRRATLPAPEPNDHEGVTDGLTSREHMASLPAASHHRKRVNTMPIYLPTEDYACKLVDQSSACISPPAQTETATTRRVAHFGGISSETETAPTKRVTHFGGISSQTQPALTRRVTHFGGMSSTYDTLTIGPSPSNA